MVESRKKNWKLFGCGVLGRGFEKVLGCFFSGALLIDRVVSCGEVVVVETIAARLKQARLNWHEGLICSDSRRG